MSDTKYDNPLVAGFNTATAEEPPFPAQQHLDATDGHKVAPPVTVQEYGSGTTHEVDSAGGIVGEGDGGAADDAVAEGDYEAKGVTVAHLQAEIDRRNEGRDEADQISRDGKKADLIAALTTDDESA